MPKAAKLWQERDQTNVVYGAHWLYVWARSYKQSKSIKQCTQACGNMWKSHSARERPNTVTEMGKWWPWNCPWVPIPFFHILKRSLRFAIISLPFRGIYQANLSGVIFQRGREVSMERGGRWAGGRARMGGMKKGVQSVWEVTVRNWMSGDMSQGTLTRCKTALSEVEYDIKSGREIA